MTSIPMSLQRGHCAQCGTNPKTNAHSKVCKLQMAPKVIQDFYSDRQEWVQSASVRETINGETWTIKLPIGRKDTWRYMPGRWERSTT